MNLLRPAALLITALLLLAPSHLAAFDTVLVDYGRGNLVVFIPDDYTPDRAWPLLYNLHGFTSNGDEAELYLGFQRFVDELGFFLVAPTGTRNPVGQTYWDATPACCEFYGQSPGDAEYLRRIYEEVAARWRISHAALFGHSNGGFMANRMACEHGDVVRAIASLAGANFNRPQDCQATHPVRSLQIHGDRDLVVLYEGGIVPGGGPYPGAFESVEQRALLHGCTGVTERGDRMDLSAEVAGQETRVLQFLQDCPPGGETELWTLREEDHVPDFQLDFARRTAVWLLAGPSEVEELGPPDPPVGLTATAVSATTVALRWTDASSNENGFLVEVQTNGGPWLEAASEGLDASEATVSGLRAASDHRFRVRARNGLGESAPSNVASATTPALTEGCSSSATAACLSSERFRVDVTYRTRSGDSGAGRSVELTTDTATFWFFEADNVEVIVKVLDACSFSQRFWVFAAGLTDVEVRITVTDTVTGAVRTYDNPQGTPLRPVQDTAAFDGCPSPAKGP
ncbi:MAG: fibronectin type III domain-containing protein [Acidobacteriota bacterium]